MMRGIIKQLYTIGEYTKAELQGLNYDKLSKDEDLEEIFVDKTSKQYFMMRLTRF